MLGALAVLEDAGVGPLCKSDLISRGTQKGTEGRAEGDSPWAPAARVAFQTSAEALCSARNELCSSSAWNSSVPVDAEGAAEVVVALVGEGKAATLVVVATLVVAGALVVVLSVVFLVVVVLMTTFFVVVVVFFFVVVVVLTAAFFFVVAASQPGRVSAPPLAAPSPPRTTKPASKQKNKLTGLLHCPLLHPNRPLLHVVQVVQVGGVEVDPVARQGLLDAAQRVVAADERAFTGWGRDGGGGEEEEEREGFHGGCGERG